jgi:hypothetical protein
MKKVDQSLEMNPMSEPNPTGAVRGRFPTFHYEGPEELEIPPHGTMVVVYKEVESNEKKIDGKHWYTCDIEIRHIKSAEALKEDEAPARRDTGTEDALDRLMEEHEAHEGQEGDES